MKPIFPLLAIACLLTPALTASDSNPTLRIEIQTPSPLYDLEITHVYRADDHLIIIGESHKSELGLVSKTVMGKASDSIDLLDPELAKLPRKIYIVQAWNYSEGYTFISKAQIPGIIQGAKLIYQSESALAKNTKKPKAQDLIGMHIDAATTLCKEHDIPSRIVSVDGQPRPTTMDFRPNRLNFHVENGKVVKVTKG